MSDKVQYTHINFSSIPSCCTPLGAASKWYLSAVTVAELLSQLLHFIGGKQQQCEESKQLSIQSSQYQVTAFCTIEREQKGGERHPSPRSPSNPHILGVCPLSLGRLGDFTGPACTSAGTPSNQKKAYAQPHMNSWVYKCVVLEGSTTRCVHARVWLSMFQGQPI